MSVNAIAAARTKIQAIQVAKVKLNELQHPKYVDMWELWAKFRLVYESGDDFIEKYLQQFTRREDVIEFQQRKDITYVPAFSKAAVNEVKDSIFQRITDVTREDGPQSYLDAALGKRRGVDLKGSTMNSFVGRCILPDLLSIGKVGVFVDMPPLDGPTLASKGSSRPYIYTYKAEDILNWVVDTTSDDAEFTTLLLRDYANTVDQSTGLPTATEERYRLMWTDEGAVRVQLFNKDSVPIDQYGREGISILTIDLPTIPFVMFDVQESLLTDVANYQIALLNLASSDVSYSLRSNFPFYVEHYDPKSESLHLRRPSGGDTTAADGVTIVRAGEEADAQAAKSAEIKVGTASGRRIPKGMDLPEFIHPSPEPLQASMAKQDELKADIRHLIKLAVSQLAPKMASAESKGFDERSLEAGLSAIGLELEHGERVIARYWAMYEDKSGKQPTITYPQRYSLRTDKDKRDESKELRDSAKAVPSTTYRREAMKQVATINLGAQISLETLRTIHDDIDKAEVVIVDASELKDDIETGLIDLEAASRAKSYPEGSVEKAKKDHADRVARIAESQGQARGTPDLGGVANTSKNEKQETADQGVVTDTTRGGAK